MADAEADRGVKKKLNDQPELSKDYNAVKNQARSYIGQIGIGGATAGMAQDSITDYLGYAVDNGLITFTEGEQILDQLGLS